MGELCIAGLWFSKNGYLNLAALTAEIHNMPVLGEERVTKQ